MYEKITILQISDLHAGVGMASPSRNEGDQLPALYHHLHETLPDLKKRHEIFNLVVFNGDCVDLGETDNFPNVRKHFIAPLIDELDPKMVIAVPGNHDVNGADLKNDRGLGQFISVFGSHPKGSLACNPLRKDGPVFTHPNSKVQIWTVNSAYLARKTDPDWDYFIDSKKFKDSDSYPWKVDPAYVNPDHMDECSSALHGDSFRIAVIHHNPIPCPGEGSKDGKMKKYRFVNDGDLNKFLAQHEFRLVLHGHQHVSRISYYSPYSDWFEEHNKETPIPSYLHCGFLTIGAPTFGGSKDLGFNVIELDISDVPYVVIAKVHQYTLAYNQLKKSKLTFLLPFKPIRKDISELLHGITYETCGSEQGYQNVKELHREKTEKIHFKRIRMIRTKTANICGIYSVSVFAPKLWGTENLADLFLPVGKRNIAYGVALAKRNEFHLHKKNKALKNRLNKGHPSLYFSFSNPLCDAIENALSISQKLKVAARLRDCLKSEKFRGDIELPQLDFLQRCFGPSKKKTKDVFNSLSIWDNAGRKPVIDTRHLVKNKPKENELNKIVQAMTGLPNIGEMRVTISRLRGTPRFNFAKSGPSRGLVKSLFEFPRILIWDDTSFDKPEALQCVEFHEECAMPLFWLCPSRLNTRGAANTNLRDRIGHVTFFALRDSRGNILIEAEDLWNNEIGEEAAPPETWTGGQIEWIWRTERTEDGYPAYLDPHGKLVEEFMYLLKRPDIMFAADAWGMRLLGDKTWNELMTVLETIDCSAWLDEK